MDFKLKKNLKDGNKAPINFNITASKLNNQKVELECKSYYNSYNLNEENMVDISEKGDKIEKKSIYIYLILNT